MPKIKVVGHTVQAGEHKQTNGQTDGRMDATKRIISQASLSINIIECSSQHAQGAFKMVGRSKWLLFRQVAPSRSIMLLI